MVPRENDSDSVGSPKMRGGLSGGLLNQWARMLTVALRPFFGLRSALVRPRIPMPDARTFATDWTRLLSAGQDSAGRSTAALVVFAVVVAGIGAAASVLISDQGALQAIVGALIGMGWVMIRLPIMQAVFRSTDPVTTSRLTESWVAGSVPYVLAVNPPLRVIAWLIGAVLAYRVLSKDGTDPRRVRSTIAISFGFEAVGALAVLSTRYVMVILELI